MTRPMTPEETREWVAQQRAAYQDATSDRHGAWGGIATRSALLIKTFPVALDVIEQQAAELERLDLLRKGYEKIMGTYSETNRAVSARLREKEAENERLRAEVDLLTAALKQTDLERAASPFQRPHHILDEKR